LSPALRTARRMPGVHHRGRRRGPGWEQHRGRCHGPRARLLRRRYGPVRGNGQPGWRGRGPAASLGLGADAGPRAPRSGARGHCRAAHPTAGCRSHSLGLVLPVADPPLEDGIPDSPTPGIPRRRAGSGPRGRRERCGARWRALRSSTMSYPVKLLVRLLLTWPIEAAALIALASFLPGLQLSRWETGAMAIVAIALLNALLRPLILLLAVNLPLILFGVLSLSLNAIMIIAAAEVVPGFAVDSIW